MTSEKGSLYKKRRGHNIVGLGLETDSRRRQTEAPILRMVCWYIRACGRYFYTRLYCWQSLLLSADRMSQQAANAEIRVSIIFFPLTWVQISSLHGWHQLAWWGRWMRMSSTRRRRPRQKKRDEWRDQVGIGPRLDCRFPSVRDITTASTRTPEAAEWFKWQISRRVQLGGLARWRARRNKMDAHFLLYDRRHIMQFRVWS